METHLTEKYDRILLHEQLNPSKHNDLCNHLLKIQENITGNYDRQYLEYWYHTYGMFSLHQGVFA